MPYRKGDTSSDLGRSPPFNNGGVLKPQLVYLHNTPEAFVGVPIYYTTDAIIFAIDDCTLQRKLRRCEIDRLLPIELPPMYLGNFQVNDGSGMLGRHKRYTYNNIDTKAFTSPTILNNSGIGFILIINEEGKKRKKMGSDTTPYILLCKTLHKCMEQMSETSPTMNLVQFKEVEKPTQEHQGTHLLTINTKDTIDLPEFFKVTETILESLEVPFRYNDLTYNAVEIIQHGFEKKDRADELWNKYSHSSIEERSDTTVCGPARLKSLHQWDTGELPHPYCNIRTYTWEQFAYAVYSILRNNTKMISLPKDEFLSQKFVFPEPFNSYFYERVAVEEMKKCKDETETVEINKEEGIQYTKRFSKAQPQPSSEQFTQLYHASYYIHGPGKLCLEYSCLLDNYFQELDITTIASSNVRHIKSAAKILLFIYKQSGFYSRIFRNYFKTGLTAYSKGGTRRWKNKETAKIYASIPKKNQENLSTPLHGAPVPNFSSGKANYRGKFPEDQEYGTHIYEAQKPRRDTTVNEANALFCAVES